MPVETVTTINITCDNDACPGNELDPTDRSGWLFVSAEVYGQPTEAFVFCSAECAGTVSLARAQDEAPATA